MAQLHNWATTWENQQCGFWPGLAQTRLYSHWRARGLKFCIKEVEGLYYPSSKNKGADQLRGGYREADMRLCFRICRLLVFSWRGSINLSRKFGLKKGGTLLWDLLTRFLHQNMTILVAILSMNMLIKRHFYLQYISSHMISKYGRHMINWIPYFELQINTKLTPYL